MAFNYITPPTGASSTSTVNSKPLLVKSAKIDIAAGSGGATATDYLLGITLPKNAQIMGINGITTTAISGGTISAATLIVKATNTILAGYNVFATGGSGNINSAGYYGALSTNIGAGDYPLYYTLTLTGTGPATAGVIYINVYYVV
jgi:hypothetical protein